MLIHRHRKLKIAHLNVNSITGKLDLLKHFLATAQIDIMAISETKLKPSTPLLIENYSIVRNDRLVNNGGGVCLIIHHNICHTVVTTPGSIDTETITVKLHDCIKGKHDLVITAFYNPPLIDINAAFLSSLLSLSEYSLVLGDLNAHHPAWQSAQTNKSGSAIYELLSSNKLIMLNNEEATFAPLARPDYKAILDFALSSEPLCSLVSNFQVTDDLRSDHLTFTLEIDSKNPAYTRAKRETKKVAKLNQASFIESCNKRELGHLLYSTTTELEASVASVTKAIQDAITEATEVKEVSFNPDHHLQLPGHIVKLIGQRNKLRRHFTNQRLPELRTQANKLNVVINAKIIEHKRNKFRTFCTSLNGHTASDSTLWKKISAIESSTQEKPPKTPTLTQNGATTADPRKVAQIFADQQEAVFTEPSDPAFDAEFKQEVDAHNPHIFSYEVGIEPELTTLKEVTEQIEGLRTKGAPGPDKITNIVLKRLPTAYRQELTHIMNASLKLAHVPMTWKEATVVMIPKPMKDHHRAENFRPISLLNTLSKLMERIVLIRVRTWIATKELLSKYQCGFRHKKQTKDHILRIFQDALKAFNNNMYMGALFIDIEKAFDKVWHSGLLHNLDELEIPVYLGRWIESYLTGRHFRVRVGQILSEIKLIGAGVPQGSVLGPVLFNVYFNKVSTCTNAPNTLTHTQMQRKLAELAMFADDLSSWAAAMKLGPISKRLQQVLDNIESWMNKWRMKVSTSKTVCTVFNKHGHNMGAQLGLKYKGTTISSDPNPKFLGVILDPALKLNKHTETIIQRANKRLNMIKSVRGKDWGASSKLTMTMYKSLVRPLIEYVPFTTLTLHETNHRKLEVIQRAAVRKAYHWPGGTSTSVMYKKHHIESIKARAIRLSDRYIYKAYHTNEIVRELITDYNIVPANSEGVWSHTLPRATVLGKIKEKTVYCKEIFKEISQKEQWAAIALTQY